MGVVAGAPGIARLPWESKARYRPAALRQGRKAVPPPAAAFATAEVVPATPQFTLLTGGRVVLVVPPGTVVSVVPPPGAGAPGDEPGSGSGAVFSGAAAMPTMERLRRRLPV